MPSSRRLGDYELLEVLGQGSFGTVWEARHITLGRHSAVKVLDRLHADGQLSKRFLREAQIAGALRHPNIVRVFEICKGDAQRRTPPFLVYELIEGVSLSDWVHFNKIPPRGIAALIAKLAGAVHYAHEHRIVHRDLKPANIIVDLAGEPHITDFGLARKLDDRFTEDNVTLGTVAYMSPEQARGDSHEVDCRADIFSLGVILYELVTGHLPFDSQTIAGYLVELSSGGPVPLRQKDSSVPRDLETICLKCLSRNPRDRYPGALALQNDLERFIKGCPIQARPIRAPERFRRWCRRQPLAAALLGLLTILAIAGPAVALYQMSLQRDLAERTRSLTASKIKQHLFCKFFWA